MRIIDLTHEIMEQMPVYPGTEPPKIEVVTTIDRDGFEERLLTMFSHTGTHMDAPSHIIKGAETLSDFDVSDFAGAAVLIDVRDMKSVDAGYIRSHAHMLAKAEFAVLFSGWDRYWGSSAYFENYPVLTPEASELLCSYGLKGICMDMISIDPADTETFDNHKIIFGGGMFVVENLKSLDMIGEKKFLLTCLPMNIKGGDGSPVRAFASV